MRKLCLPLLSVAERFWHIDLIQIDFTFSAFSFPFTTFLPAGSYSIFWWTRTRKTLVWFSLEKRRESWACLVLGLEQIFESDGKTSMLSTLAVTLSTFSTYSAFNEVAYQHTMDEIFVRPQLFATLILSKNISPQPFFPVVRFSRRSTQHSSGGLRTIRVRLKMWV